MNNDTEVTPFWIENLLKHFDGDEKIGLVGPVTNNIGNEARLETNYSNYNEMIKLSYDVYYSNIGKSYPMNVIAFFAVMIKKEVFDKIGVLDKGFWYWAF